MDKAQVAASLVPGTAWNLRGNVLEQAQDAAARVQIPTDTQIQAAMPAASPAMLAWQTAKASLSPDVQAALSILAKRVGLE